MVSSEIMFSFPILSEINIRFLKAQRDFNLRVGTIDLDNCTRSGTPPYLTSADFLAVKSIATLQIAPSEASYKKIDEKNNRKEAVRLI